MMSVIVYRIYVLNQDLLAEGRLRVLYTVPRCTPLKGRIHSFYTLIDEKGLLCTSSTAMINLKFRLATIFIFKVYN